MPISGFFSAGLPEVFTSKDYAKAARLSVKAAQTAVRVLAKMGAAVREGKRGREYLYGICRGGNLPPEV